MGALEKAAQSVYDTLKESGIDVEEAKGWFSKILSGIGDFFVSIGTAIADFFKSIFM